VQRDADGRAWHSNEYYKRYQDVKTGEEFIVTRKQALGERR
jgi:hypothetical protein